MSPYPTLLLALTICAPSYAEVYENFTCDLFEGNSWLDTSYPMSLAEFSTFWVDKQHWFSRLTELIMEDAISFPIMEATGWKETEWLENPYTGRIQRTLLYDIDPKSAFVTTSHVNETQVVVNRDSYSLTFLRVLSNSGFPLADTFHVEFLLCAEKSADGVRVSVRGRIIADSSLYFIVEGTVENGVNAGAKEYYSIFDKYIKKWIEREAKSAQDPLNISDEDYFDTDDLQAILDMGRNSTNRSNTPNAETEKLASDYFYYVCIGTVALLLTILTIVVRRQTA